MSTKVFISKSSGRPKCPECGHECMVMTDSRQVKTIYGVYAKVSCYYYKCLTCGTEMQDDIQNLEGMLSMFKDLEAKIGTSKLEKEDLDMMNVLINDIQERRAERESKINSGDSDNEAEADVAEECRTI